MRVVFSQVWQSLTKNIAISVWTVILFSASIFIIAGVGGYIDSSGKLMESFKESYSEDTARVMLRVRMDYLNSITKNKESYSSFLSFLQKFKSDYPHINLMPASSIIALWVKGYDGPYEYAYDYLSLPDIHAFFNGERFSRMNCVYTDSTFLEYFDLQIAEGKGFSDCAPEDFIFGDDKVYPVILGAHMKGTYQIGDLIECRSTSLLSPPNENKDLVYRVIGFLREGAALLPFQEYNNDTETTAESLLVYLDSYYILPVLDMSAFFDLEIPGVSSGEKAQRLSMHFMVTNGYFFIFGKNMSDKELVDIFLDYAFDNGQSDAFTYNSGFMKIPHQMYREMDTYFKLLVYCGLFIAATSIICISTNLVNKINKNMKNYAIHMLCGSRLTTLRWFVSAELISLMIISNITAVTALYFFGESLFSFSFADIYSARITFSAFTVAFVLLINLLVLGISLIFPIIKINVIEYDRLLRGVE